MKSEKKRGMAFLLIVLWAVLCSFPCFSAQTVRLKLTVLYDNYTAAEGTQADWGFSCLAEGGGKSILFDTGTKTSILKANTAALKVDLSRMDMVVISHLHGDHIGGLEWVLSHKKGIPVYLPASADDAFLTEVKGWGGCPVRVKEAIKLCDRIFLTGEMPADFNPEFTEQSMIFVTVKGSVVLTGCAHPGIVAIARRASEMIPGKLYACLGGFHLVNKNEEHVQGVLAEFRKLGVECCGATHCTGDKAIAAIRDAYAEHYLPLGVGRVLEFDW